MICQNQAMLPPNLTHRAGFGVDAIFELMAHRLALDGLFKEGHQVRVCAPIAQGISKIDFFVRQQTHPHPAIGGEAHAVTIVAVGVADRADKANGAFAPGQPVHPRLTIQMAIVGCK